MGSKKVVGRVAVKVMPDITLFKKRLKSELESWDKKKKIEFEADLAKNSLKKAAAKHLKDFKRDFGKEDAFKVQYNATVIAPSKTAAMSSVKKARTALQNYAKAWSKEHPVEFEAGLQAFHAELKLDRDNLRKVREDLEDWADKVSPLKVYVHAETSAPTMAAVRTRLDILTRPRVAPVTVALDHSSYAKVATALAALSGARAIYNMGDKLWDSLKDLDKAVPVIAGLTLAITNLGSAAIATTSSMFSLGAGLAAIAPMALTLPGLLGGIAIGIGGTAAALADFNKRLPQVKKQFQKMQDVISASFWKEARNPMAQFFNRMMPQFTREMNSTGRSLGSWFGSFSTEMTSVFDGKITPMFNDLRQSIAISERYVGNFANIIANLGEVGAASLPRLSHWFGEISKRFDGWLDRNTKSGQMDIWVDEAIDNFNSLGVILRETGQILGNFGRAAKDAGGATLDSTAASLERIADVTAKPAFQEGMVRAFRSAHEAMDEISNGSGEQFKNLMTELSYTMTDALPTAGRAMGKAMGAVFDGLATPKFQKSITRLFSNIEKAVDDLAPSMPALASMFADLMDVIGELSIAISRTLAPVIDVLAPKVSSLARTLGPLISEMSAGLSGIANMTGFALKDISGEFLAAGAAALMLSRAYQGNKRSVEAFNEATKQGRRRIRENGEEAGRTAEQISRQIDRYNDSRAAMAPLPPLYKRVSERVRDFGTDVGIVGRTVRDHFDPSLIQTGRTLRALSRETGETGSALRNVGKAVTTASIGVGAMAVASTGLGDKLNLTNTAALGLAGFAVGGPIGAAIGAGVGLITDMASAAGKASEGIEKMRSAASAAGLDMSALSDITENGDAALKAFRDNLGWMMKAGGAVKGWVNAENATDKFKKALESTQEKAEGVQKAMLDIGSALDGTDSEAFSLVTRSTEELQQIADRAAPAMKALKITVEDLQKASESERNGFVDSIARWTREADSAEGRAKAFGQAIKDLDNDLLSTAESANALRSALEAVVSPQIAAERATDQWNRTLQGLGGSFQSGAGLDGVTEAASQNREALRGATEDLVNYIGGLGQTNASAKEVAIALANQRQALIDSASAAGRSSSAVEDYINKLGMTPEFVNTYFATAGIEGGIAKMDEYRKAAKGLPKRLVTELIQSNYPISIERIATLAKKYKDTPEKVVTKIEAEIAKATKAISDVEKKGSEVDKETFKPTVDADGKPAEKIFTSTTRALAEIDKTVAKPTVEVNDKASSVLDDIRSKLNALDGKKVTATTTNKIVTQFSTKGARSSGSASNSSSGASGSSDRVISPQQPVAFAAASIADASAAAIASKATAAMSLTVGGIVQTLIGGAAKSVVPTFKDLSKAIEKLVKDAARGAKGVAKMAEAFEALEISYSRVERTSDIAAAFNSRGSSLQSKLDKQLTDAKNESSNAKGALKRANKELEAAKKEQAKAKTKKEKQAAKNKVANATAAQAKAQSKYNAELAEEKKIRETLTPAWQAQMNIFDLGVDIYDELQQKLTQAQSALDALNKEIVSYKGNLLDSFLSNASIFEAPIETFKSLTAHLQERIDNMYDYQAGLKQLQGWGLDERIYKEILDEGPDALSMIEAILEGGKAGVAEINALYKDMADLSAAVANTGANYVYADELKDAQNLVDATYSALTQLKPLLDQIANDLSKSITDGVTGGMTEALKMVAAMGDEYKGVATGTTYAKETKGTTLAPVSVNKTHKWVAKSAKDQACKTCGQPRNSGNHNNRSDGVNVSTASPTATKIITINFATSNENSYSQLFNAGLRIAGGL